MMKEDDVRELFNAFRRWKEPFWGMDAFQWIECRKESYIRFKTIFDPSNLENMSQEDFWSFLDFKVNKSWTGLHRRGKEVTKNLQKLMEAIAFLQDDSVDIRTRINDVLREDGKHKIRGMGKNLATAILHVCKPDRYGVWNNRVEGALEKLELLPEPTGNWGEYYTRINRVLNNLKTELNTDLTTIDCFMYYIDIQEEGVEGAAPLPTVESYSVNLERDLETFIFNNLRSMEEGLRPYKGEEGRQYTIKSGRIDIIAQDKEDNFVVIELKAETATDPVLTQILAYMADISREIANGKKVRGIIVAYGFADRLVTAASLLPNLRLMKYKVKFEFEEVASVYSKKVD